MSLPIRVIVRTKVDWSSLTWETFSGQTTRYKPDLFILETWRRRDQSVINLWEVARGRSYFEYRGQVRDACQRELEKLPVRLTVGLANEQDWKEGEDEILVPIDDDDMVRPSIEEIAALYDDPAVNVVFWNRLTHYPDGSQEWSAPRAYCDTCNYSVRKSFLMGHPISAGDFLNNHQMANAILRKRLGLTELSLYDRLMRGDFGAAHRQKVIAFEPILGPSVKETNADHSVYYLHTGSISFLLRKIPRNVDPVAVIRSLPLHPLVKE